eukprot:g8500.t1
MPKHKLWKGIRRLVNQIGAKSLPNKKALDDKVRKKEEKIKKAWRRQTMITEDAKRMESVALRQGRLQAMASLCDLNESNVDNLNLVPDGATYHALPAGVVDMGPAPMALDDEARPDGASSSPEPSAGNGISSPGDWVAEAASSSPTCAAPATVPSDSELPPAASLQRPRSCYVCKVKFWRLHHFYDSLCPECASLNYEKRFQQPKLNSSYIYLVTGGRVKIGFHTAVKLLNAGATVLVTSRFRNDCLERFVNFYGRDRFFAKEWEEVVNVDSLGVPAGGPAQVVRRQTSIADRLVLLGVDLRFLPRVEQLCDYVVANYPHLDGVIHNACQTIRRPHMYYEPLREKERAIGYDAGVLGIEDVGRQICPQQGVFYDYGLNKLNNNKPLPSTTIIDRLDAHLQNTPSTSTGATSPASSTPDNKQLHHLRDEVEHHNPYPAQESQTLQTQSESDHVLHLTTTDDAAIKIGSKDLPGYTDVNGQLIDYREKHSWVYKLQDVETPELVECFLINAMAPFVMNGRLKNLLERAPARGRATPSSTSSSPPAENKMKKMTAAGAVSAVRRSFIVNVSAMEGKFYRYKTPNHPHTNMAKASLNMMTKTSARDYAEHSSIFMNSVDTGWINDEKPVKQAFEHAKTRNWQTPIDEIDAAARILDPIFSWVVGADGRVVAARAAGRGGEPRSESDQSLPQLVAHRIGDFLYGEQAVAGFSDQLKFESEAEPFLNPKKHKLTEAIVRDDAKILRLADWVMCLLHLERGRARLNPPAVPGSTSSQRGAGPGGTTGNNHRRNILNPGDAHLPLTATMRLLRLWRRFHRAAMVLNNEDENGQDWVIRRSVQDADGETSATVAIGASILDELNGHRPAVNTSRDRARPRACSIARYLAEAGALETLSRQQARGVQRYFRAGGRLGTTIIAILHLFVIVREVLLLEAGKGAYDPNATGSSDYYSAFLLGGVAGVLCGAASPSTWDHRGELLALYHTLPVGHFRTTLEVAGAAAARFTALALGPPLSLTLRIHLRSSRATSLFASLKGSLIELQNMLAFLARTLVQTMGLQVATEFLFKLVLKFRFAREQRLHLRESGALDAAAPVAQDQRTGPRGAAVHSASDASSSTSLGSTLSATLNVVRRGSGAGGASPLHLRREIRDADAAAGHRRPSMHVRRSTKKRSDHDHTSAIAEIYKNFGISFETARLIVDEALRDPSDGKRQCFGSGIGGEIHSLDKVSLNDFRRKLEEAMNEWERGGELLLQDHWHGHGLLRREEEEAYLDYSKFAVLDIINDLVDSLKVEVKECCRNVLTEETMARWDGRARQAVFDSMAPKKSD